MEWAIQKCRICFSVTGGFFAVLSCLGSDLGLGRMDTDLGSASSGAKLPREISHSVYFMRWLTVEL